jgi:hypothetical protein
MSKLKNKAPNHIIRPLLLRELARNNHKIFFMLFLAIWALQNGPKMMPEGLQVDQMYSLISKLKNKPLTKTLGPLSWKKWF